MENLFFNHGKDKLLWETEDKILLAISGGVDSMVLLRLMEKLALKETIFLVVAHVNHKLRQESDEEEAYLRAYCKRKGIPFYSIQWQQATSFGMEEAARNFRYNFFQEVMEQTACNKLMTAHHGDDQAETLIMKLARGGSLNSHIGIQVRQPFSNGELIRPLLQFSKEDIRKWAAEQSLVFFEDQTNEDTHVQRNRIRKWVVPELKKENARLLAHAQQFSQQLEWAEALISEQMEKEFQTHVKKQAESWQIEGDWLMALPENQQYFFLSYFFKKSLSELQVGAKEEQLLQLLRLLKKEKAQWQVAFSNEWFFKKSYQQFSLEKNKQVTDEHHVLHYDEGVYLNDREWIGILKNVELDKVPAELEQIGWSTFRQDFPKDLAKEFFLRRRRDGERLHLTKNLTKKVSRYFIDNKVMNAKRATAWVLTDSKNNIYGLLPFTLSYLSIMEETDKIHYVLLYKYRE
ncbi:tRNA(Ile)-lysidine synthetase domain-containing protein [Enterococcus sp. AZ194]|uniref:tRNA lysidine(34) synthetase TilS n=1 Tax=Enterococcus sp. AZ194 TaxID=2774629 RepID=UPI003F280F2E